MVVSADTKTDYGSISEPPTGILAVVRSTTSGSGGGQTAVTGIRNPSLRSVYSSSQSLAANSNLGSLSSSSNVNFDNINHNNNNNNNNNNNGPFVVNTHNSGGSGGRLRQNSESTLSNASVTSSLRGRVPQVGLDLALGLVREATGVGTLPNISGAGKDVTENNSGIKFMSAVGTYSNSSSPMSTTSGDLLYQRQPLLHDHKNDWANDGPEEVIRSDSVYHEEKRNGSMTRIQITSDDGEVNELPRRFPREKKKTLIAFLFLSGNFMMATVSLALTHERLPDYKPLPDIFLDNIVPQDWALDVSEILIMLLVTTTSIVLVLHKHRWIVFRRTFIMLGLLYMMRSITMFVTVLPKSNPNYYCSPKANSTNFFIIAKRAIQLMSGMGLSINGQQVYCGDFIFSGHTVILVTAYLLIQEYTPKKRAWVLHWAAWIASTVGVVMVLVARGHYTIDVIIAYFVTTVIFWIYHTLAHNAHLKVASQTNYLSKVWWFPLFQYMEARVASPLPNAYSFPWSKSHRSRRNF